MTGLRLAPFLAAAVAAALLAGCAPGAGSGAGQGAAPVVRVLFLGDTSHGENYQRELAAAGGKDVLARRGYDYPLSRAKPLLAGADLVIANLETPLIVPEGESPLAGRKDYVHWSDPEKSPAALARHNLGAVCLANNHAMDYGLAGLRSTLAALAKHGIRAYGAGAGEAAATAPLRAGFLVAGLPVRLACLAGFEQRRAYHELGFYARGESGGVAALDVDRLCVQVELLKRDDPGLFVAVTPHWGRNYGPTGKAERAAARRLIDAGADLIVGHGAHHLQGVERYRGRWVVYNLGNFMFNSPGRYSQYRSHGTSLAAELRFGAEDGRVRARLRLYPLVTDNLRTGYRPAPAGAADFEKSRAVLGGKTPGPDGFAARARPGRDAFGRYFELEIQAAAPAAPAALPPPAAEGER